MICQKIRIEVVKGVLFLKATDEEGIHTRYFRVNAATVRDLCRISRVPLKYANSLPATLKQQNINHGLAKLPDSITFEMKETANGSRVKEIPAHVL